MTTRGDDSRPIGPEDDRDMWSVGYDAGARVRGQSGFDTYIQDLERMVDEAADVLRDLTTDTRERGASWRAAMAWLERFEGWK